MTWLKLLWRNDRARQAIVAALIAALLGGIDFFEPLRPVEWQAQARIAPRSGSGDVLFIQERDDSSGTSNAQAREELARLIDKLTIAGADKIFLDDVFDRPTTTKADKALARAIARSGRVVLVQQYLETAAGERVRFTLPSIAGSAPQVISKQRISTFGFVWSEPYFAVIDGALLPSLPAAVAHKMRAGWPEFPIDYSIAYSSIPSLTIDQAMAAPSPGDKRRLATHKTVVIGKAATGVSFASIPGIQHVPPTMVAILAAETLKGGPPVTVWWFAPWLVVFAFLLIVVLAVKSERRRRAGYVGAVALIPASFLVFAHLHVFADLAVPTAALGIFGALRLWHLRQQRGLLVDEVSGLPSFRKLEQDLAERDRASQPPVVVAKIHRFDEVLSSLPARSHRDYVRLLAERLRIADEDLVVYSNGGRYLAWLQEMEDEEELQAHLNGLRAVFAHPLHVAGTAVDVGITFGADATAERDPARKVAAAASAAEKTTEAHMPVLLARESSETDRLWNISLQAKIDDALASGEIFVVYQPQIDLRTGELLGAEALVRWMDRERGQISPSYFVEQCEQVGRMDALTRKVFEEAVATVASSPLRDADFQLSMNVSATLLHDLRVVEMLTEVLAFTSLPASRLTLEITETSRITDYHAARAVMDKLHKLGVRLSIDDFGVGAASLETLLLLPFDELKIDRMFVSRVRDNDKARSIVEGLVSLARDLDIVAIAEGVEDAETLAVLRETGCDAAQGYFLGRPGALRLLADRGADRSVMAAP